MKSGAVLNELVKKGEGEWESTQSGFFVDPDTYPG